MLDRPQEGVAARERLVADASHELRSPLTAMRAEIEVSLRHDPLDHGARALLSSLRDEVLRVGRIVEDLLTLARADGGRLELLVAPIALRDLAERVVATHLAVADTAGVTLAVTGSRGTAPGDADRLMQVVGNLVDNAVRASPPGSRVAVHVWEDGATSGITVTDEGPGLPVEARQRIFTRFVREDPARGRDGGAGLGLAICAEIVRAHGGTIDVADGPHRGSAFTMSLPTEADVSRSSRGRRTSSASSQPASPPSRSPHADRRRPRG